MKKLTKALCLLFAVMLLSTACGGGQQGADTTAPAVTTAPQGTDKPWITNPPDNNNTNPPSNTPEEIVTLTLVNKGQTEFRIVWHSEDDSSITPEYVRDLQTAIRDKSGITMSIKRDTEVEASDSKKEILVGRTDRAETEYFYSDLGYNDYTVSAKGNKLVLVGADEEKTKLSIEYFINNVLSKLSSSTPRENILEFSSTSNYTYSGFYPLKNTEILGTALKYYTMVLPSDASFDETRFAALLNAYFKNMTGKGVRVVTDTTAAVEHEIRIGKTSRTKATVANHEYAVVVKDGNIEITAGSLHAYDAAYSYMQSKGLSELRKLTEEKELVRKNITSELTGGTELILGKTQGSDLRIMYHNVWGWEEGAAHTDKRNQMLSELYLSYSPDVLCLVECTSQIRGKSSLIAAMEANGYAEVTNNSDGGKLTATPVLYKTSVLTHIASETVKFTTGGGDDKFITWAVLEEKATGKRVCIASTHLAYQTTTQGNTWRKEQVEQLCGILDNVRSQYNCAVIIGGDMNCKVSSEPYNLYGTKGYTNVHDTALKTENVGTAYDYPTFNEISGYFDRVSFREKEYKDALDHVFTKGGGITFERFDVVTDTYAQQSSDHMPIVVDFSFNADYTLSY